MGRWAFPELRGDDVRRDPNEAELFKTEQTAEGEYAGTDALVREILQNSIDARRDETPVCVRLALHDAADAPALERLAYYFARLKPALLPRGITFNPGGVPQLPCRFLVVEDFGTCGLEGDTLLFRDPPERDNSRQFFYWFWRNIGRSGKTGDDLGRWGLGKTVYRAASRVGCMFGLTIRDSDRRKLLMGQAVLQIHEHQLKEYKPEGYWCGSQNAQGLPLPIEDDAGATEEVRRFCAEWRISRTNEPGLSIVSPFVPDELQAERLLQAVAVYFFTRILRGELEVIIAGPGIGTVRLDCEGIGAACRKIVWDGPPRTKRHIAPPIAFARECVNTTPELVTGVLGEHKVPELTEAVFSSDVLHLLRRQFSAGELISVRVRVNLPRRDGTAEVGYADVFVQRTSDGQRCDSYYVREGMTITKISAQAGRRGVQSLVLVDSGPLAQFLGDTEGPAHEDWDQSAERPEKIWARGWKGRVKFVRRIVDSLVELLTPPATEPDFDLLSDFFSIERTGGEQRQRKPGEDSKVKPRMEPVVAEPKWFHITSRGGGFTISRNSRVEVPDKAALRVSVAYDLPRGDPLRTWSRLDFEIGNGNGALRPTGKGLHAKSLQGNILLLQSIEQEFYFSVEGFDRHRDLYVRVDDVSNTEEANHD